MAVKWQNKRSEGVATIEVKNTAVRRQRSWSSILKFPEVPEKRSNQTTTKPNQNEVKCTMAIYPKCLKQLRGVLWKIRAYIRVRMKCETIFYTRAVRSQATLPKGYVIPSDMRCLWSTSFVMYFVITSEGFEVPATFLIETTPEATSSWINRNRSWTCFVFLEVPNLVAIDLPAELSVWSRIFTFLESWDSRSSDLTFRHSKSYGVKFCFSAGESNCSLCSALRSDQSAEKVQGHAGSAPSWSSTTCPIGVHIGVDVKSRLFGMRNDLRSKCQNHRFGSCQVP